MKNCFAVLYQVLQWMHFSKNCNRWRFWNRRSGELHHCGLFPGDWEREAILHFWRVGYLRKTPWTARHDRQRTNSQHRLLFIFSSFSSFSFLTSLFPSLRARHSYSHTSVYGHPANGLRYPRSYGHQHVRFQLSFNWVIISRFKFIFLDFVRLLERRNGGSFLPVKLVGGLTLLVIVLTMLITFVDS